MARPKIRGFSLIELMIVVAVLGILALIVIPKMSELIRKGNEAGTRGHLGAVRGALRIYFLNNEEVYPQDVTVILAPGNDYYTGPMPTVFTVQHGKRQAVNQVLVLAPLADSGEWGYVNDGADRGHFWAQCIHTDAAGKVWSQF